jgi:hypothetical protein
LYIKPILKPNKNMDKIKQRRNSDKKNRFKKAYGVTHTGPIHPGVSFPGGKQGGGGVIRRLSQDDWYRDENGVLRAKPSANEKGWES